MPPPPPPPHPFSQKIHPKELGEVSNACKILQDVWHAAEGVRLPRPEDAASEEDLRSTEERPQVRMGCLRPLKSVALGLVGSCPYKATEGAPAYSLAGSNLSRIPSPECRGWGGQAKADLSLYLLWAWVKCHIPPPTPHHPGGIPCPPPMMPLALVWSRSRGCVPGRGRPVSKALTPQDSIW